MRAGDTVALSLGASRDDTADVVGVLYAIGYLGAALLPLYPDVPQGRRQELAATFGARWSVSPETEALGVAALPIADICDKSHTAKRADRHAPAARRPGGRFYPGDAGTRDAGAAEAVVTSVPDAMAGEIPAGTSASTPIRLPPPCSPWRACRARPTARWSARA